MNFLKWVREMVAGSDEAHELVEREGWKPEQGHVEGTPSGGFIWKEDRPQMKNRDDKVKKRACIL